VENDHTLIFPGRRLAANGLEAWAQVLERGYEGLAGKDDASPYRGGRTLSWLKVKQRDYRVEARGWDPRAKVSQGLIHQLETGLVQDVRSQAVVKLAKALGMPVTELLG